MKLYKYSILFVMLAYIAMHLAHGYWRKPGLIISTDVTEYYSYLPATFIYHDITLKFKDSDPVFFSNKLWGQKLENGNYVPKVTMGLSVLYAPFFFLSHGIAQITTFEADGYSKPYGVGLTVASLAYFFLGLLILKKILIRTFSQQTTAIVILVLGLATNISVYVTKQAAMPHAFNFFLFTAFLLFTIRWHYKTTYFNSLMIGLIIGLISLIRPTNAIIIIIFLLWGIESFAGFRYKLTYLFKHNTHHIFMFLISFLVWIPQLLFWKFVTGDYLYYSYGQESFFFLNPQIADVLFSFRKGWLLYTPVMIFSIIGIVHLYKYHRKMFTGICIFFVLNLWIISSWWCWWYGGSYSQRVFIDSLPVMSFPLAALTERFRQFNPDKKLLIFLLAGLFIVHNLFQTYKYFNNAIHWDSMSRSAYIHSSFRLNPDKEFFFKIIPPDYENALHGKPERSISFESKSKKHYAFINSVFKPQHYIKLPDESDQNRQISRHNTIHELIRKTTGNAFFTRYKTNNEQHFIQGASIPTEKLMQIRTTYIAAGYFIKPTEQMPLHGAGLVMTFENTENQNIEFYHFEPADKTELQADQWNFRYFIFEIPSIAHPENTRLNCYFWNINGKVNAFVQDVSAFAILKHQNIKE